MSSSLDGRSFRSVAEVAGGEVGTETVFAYHEEGDLVWARYAGGSVRLGHLVGLRQGDALEFRYSQLNTAGESSCGVCRSTIHTLPDGRIQLRESWRWESRAGEGTSIVEEISGAGSGGAAIPEEGTVANERVPAARKPMRAG